MISAWIRSFGIVSPYIVLLSCLHAQPQGMQVVHGHAAVCSGQSHGSMAIETGHQTILNWESFSIQEWEALRFNQLDSCSAVLNRVMGAEMSQILGSLSSNGAIYLVNQNGILIGPNGVIDAASFCASTLDILDAEFLSERGGLFQGDSAASIENLGTISCSSGDIVLAARKVHNAGTLTAPKGDVLIGSSAELLIKPNGSQRIFIRLDAQPSEGDLEIGGKIEALNVEIRSLGNNPFAKAIRQSGSIAACSDGEKGGSVVICAEQGLCEVAGTILAQKQEEGGHIHALGDTIHLFPESTLDASGDKKGGEILVGGDARGENPAVRNASHVWMGEGACLKANALSEGDGGKVVIWGDESALFYGRIEARGGPHGGNGGEVEVSGERLIYHGFTDLFSPWGKPGHLLMDPSDVQIVLVGPTTGSFSACVPPSSYVFNDAVATNLIQASDLVTQLNSPCNVTIDTTTSSGMGANGGSISVLTPISWTAATTLRLKAATFIDITSGNTVTNSSVSTGFTAIDFNATTSSTQSALTVNAALTTGGGGIQLTGLSTSAAAPFSGVLITAAVTTGSGPITIRGGDATNPAANLGNGVHAQSPITSSSGNILIVGASGTTSATESGGARMRALVQTGGSGSITVMGAGSNREGLRTSTGAQFLTASGSINLAGVGGNGSSRGGIFSTAANITSSAGGTINISGTSNAVGQTDNSGAFFGGSGLTISTSGTVEFGATVTDGASFSISGCIGGASVNSYGIRVDAVMSLTGTIHATQSILGGASSDNCAGLRVSSTGSLALSTGSSLTVVASSQGPGTGCHGIDLQGNVTAVGTATISLTGLSSSGSSASHGVFFNGGIVSSIAGNIAITGTAPLGVLGTSNGINMATTNGIVSNSGLISLVGSYSGTDASSNGIAVVSSWNAATTAALSLTGTKGSDPGSYPILFSGSSVQTGGILNCQSALGIGVASCSVTSAGTMTYSSTIDSSTSTARSLTLLSSGGNIVFSGNVGSVNPLLNLSMTAVEIDVGANISTKSGTIGFASPTVFQTSSTVASNAAAASGANITFSSTVNGASSLAQSLSITAGTGTIAFNAATFGATHPLSSLSATGNSITFSNNIAASVGTLSLTGTTLISLAGAFSSTGSMTFSGPAQILTDVALTCASGNVLFSVGSGTAISGGFDLFANVNGGTFTVDGDVDLSGSSGGDGGNFFINAASGVIIDGDIDTRGGAGAGNAGGDGGTILLTSTNGSVSVVGIDSAGGSGGMTFPGGNAGSITLSPSSILSGSRIPQGIIQLGGNISALGGSGLITGLSGSVVLSASRSAPAATATITSTLGGNNVTIQADTFQTGANEAITILGSFSIVAGKLISAGDTVVLTNLTFSAPTIVAQTHGSYEIFNNQGALYTTPAVHFYAGATYTLSGVLIPTSPVEQGSFSGTFTQPQFLNLLILSGSTILNFDTEFANPSTSSVSRVSVDLRRAYIINQMGVADAELSDRLPMMDPYFYKNPRICEKQKGSKTICSPE